MRVVVTDFRFTEPDRDYHPYRETVEAAGGELVYGECTTSEAVVDACRGADVVVTFKAPITQSVIDVMPGCQLVLRNGAGYDNVDIKAATEANIPVATIRGYLNEEIAEGAMTLLLAASRDLVWADRDVRSSPGFGARKPTQLVTGRTLGIVGLGNIGTSVVSKARGLGLEVIATDPFVPQHLFDALEVERVTFDELLDRADAVSLHCQLNHSTHQLFGADEFSRMKDDAIFVNTARGPLVDEQALVDAVETGEIWGAGIDVYEHEPPGDDSPALSCDRVICSPHRIGGGDERSYQRGLEIGRGHVRRALEGQPVRDPVNPGAVKHRDGLLNPELEHW